MVAMTPERLEERFLANFDSILEELKQELQDIIAENESLITLYAHDGTIAIILKVIEELQKRNEELGSEHAILGEEYDSLYEWSRDEEIEFTRDELEEMVNGLDWYLSESLVFQDGKREKEIEELRERISTHLDGNDNE